MRWFLIFLFLPLLLFADKGSNVTLPYDQVIEGDFFAFGETVEISGTITGDLYILASQAFVDGVVKGDLLIAAGTGEIEGDIEGNVRALGGRILLGGRVGHNATVMGGSIDVSSACSVENNLVLAGGNLDMGGVVHGVATILGSGARISGTLLGPSKAYVGTLRIGPKAKLIGSLLFSAHRGATIDPRAEITGVLTEKPGPFKEVFRGDVLGRLQFGSHLLAYLMNFVYSLLVGIILLRLFRESTLFAVNALDKKPSRALWYGLVLLVVFSLAALVLLATVLGAPFAIALIALNVIGFYSAKVLFLLWISARFSKKRPLEPTLSRFVPLLLVYFAVMTLPYVGMLLSFIATLLGLGALVFTYSETRLMRLKGAAAS